jgi:hypothetical protein
MKSNQMKFEIKLIVQNGKRESPEEQTKKC